jgi:hypothetical protein
MPDRACEVLADAGGSVGREDSALCRSGRSWGACAIKPTGQSTVAPWSAQWSPWLSAEAVDSVVAGLIGCLAYLGFGLTFTLEASQGICSWPKCALDAPPQCNNITLVAGFGEG